MFFVCFFLGGGNKEATAFVARSDRQPCVMGVLAMELMWTETPVATWLHGKQKQTTIDDINITIFDIHYIKYSGNSHQ